MKTLVAILCPPVAVLFTGRPLSALLNVVLTLFFWIPGIIHALIVQSADANERRHAEMMSAVTGQVVKPRASGEQQIVMALVCLLVLSVCVSALRSWLMPTSTVQMPLAAKNAPASLAAAPAAAVPAVGAAYAQISQLHGEPQTKDRATGWATWPNFRAKFKDGVAVEVVGR